MSMATELEALGKLHRDGTLTDEEFAQAKARIVSGGDAAAGVASLLGNLDAGRLAKTGVTLGRQALTIRTIFSIIVVSVVAIGFGTFDMPGYPKGEFMAFILIIGAIVIFAPYVAIWQAKRTYDRTAGDSGRS